MSFNPRVCATFPILAAVLLCCADLSAHANTEGIPIPLGKPGSAQGSIVIQQYYGNVQYASGGIGPYESAIFEHAVTKWPLALFFAENGSDRVSDVEVHIVDARGHNVLTALSRGPCMVVRLHPGRYTVHAVIGDREKVSEVDVPPAGSARLPFEWDDSGDLHGIVHCDEHQKCRLTVL